jgi:hypothetical protein
MKPPIITLLTDFDTKDHYVASMKGVILGINPLCVFVDISHRIRPQDIREGAFVLANAYSFFPRGTIHLCVIDPGVGGSRRPILVKTRDHSFVGPDNGLFGLVLLREKAEEIIILNQPDFFLPRVSSTFHGRDLFAPVAAHLSLGIRPESFGPVTGTWKRLSAASPDVSSNRLSGEIIHIDAFGNLITSIDETLLFRFLRGRPFSIKAGDRSIGGLCKTYRDAGKGELTALIGSGGLLEIAVRDGDAGKKLKIKRGDPVRIVIEKKRKTKR